MASFGAMTRIRTGYYRAVRSWLLRERRTVAARISNINSELGRIGRVWVHYAKVPEGDAVRRTEERVAFLCTQNSSLEKLLRAYVAQGGNPLDISMFLEPDQSRQVDTESSEIQTIEKHPYGGVAYPLSYSYHATVDHIGDTVVEMKQNEDGGAESFGQYPGGYLNLNKYVPRRIGGRQDFDKETVVISSSIHQMRSWCNQEIKERLQDLEWRILKLCDLREQLIQERDILLVQAWGGIVSGVQENWDPETYVAELRVSAVMKDFDDLFFMTDETALSKNVFFVDHAMVKTLNWSYEDDVSEGLLDLMF